MSLSLMAKPVHYHLGKFPPTNLDPTRLLPLVGEARVALDTYNGIVSGIPNANVLLSPLMIQEAVLSSKIEGTTVTLGEVLEIESGSVKTDKAKLDDAEEILNYREALLFSSKSIAGGDFSLQMILDAHGLLMKGVRGQNKRPGSFRTMQNLIGRPGSTIETASFVPVAQEHLMDGLEVWMDYCQGKNEADPLLQLAVLHLEFEALHPFNDGNGRLGRMLIPLFLSYRDLLSEPNFYMSGYLEKNRAEYMEYMREVSRSDDWTTWCEFFLAGVIDQASGNEQKARAILDLHQQTRHRLADLVRSGASAKYLDFLFSTPIFTSTRAAEVLGIKKQTAHITINKLVTNEIVTLFRPSSGREPNLYAFPKLLNIVEGEDIF